MSTVISLPKRSEVSIEDTWDLSKLFPNDDAWEASLTAFEKRIAGFDAIQRHTRSTALEDLATCLEVRQRYRPTGRDGWGTTPI